MSKNKKTIYDSEYSTVCFKDDEFDKLSFTDPQVDGFAEDETFKGVAFVIHSEDATLAPLNGVYFGAGPTTHSKLRSWCSATFKYIPGPTSLNDPNFTHGFYTNKGRFITRRDAVWLAEENRIKLAVPLSSVNYWDGMLSTDIWEDAN